MTLESIHRVRVHSTSVPMATQSNDSLFQRCVSSDQESFNHEIHRDQDPKGRQEEFTSAISIVPATPHHPFGFSTPSLLDFIPSHNMIGRVGGNRFLTLIGSKHPRIVSSIVLVPMAMFSLNRRSNHVLLDPIVKFIPLQWRITRK